MVVAGGEATFVLAHTVEDHQGIPKVLDIAVEVGLLLDLEASHLRTTSVEVSSNMVNVLEAITANGNMVIVEATVGAVTLEIGLCQRTLRPVAKDNRRVARNRTLRIEFVVTLRKGIVSSEINALTCALRQLHLALEIPEDIGVILSPQDLLGLGHVAVVRVVEVAADLATHVLGRAADLRALTALRGRKGLVVTNEAEAKQEEAGLAATLHLPQHLLLASLHMC